MQRVSPYNVLDKYVNLRAKSHLYTAKMTWVEINIRHMDNLNAREKRPKIMYEIKRNIC